MKNFFVLTFLLASFFLVNNGLAVSAVPAPICTFKGSVQSVSDLVEQNKFNRQLKYYLVRIDFDKKGLECDNQTGPIYKEGDIILLEDEHTKYPIKELDYISGSIQFSGDEVLGGYFLTNVSNLYDDLTLRGNKEALITKSAQIYIPAGIILLFLLVVFLVKMKKRQNFVTIISITIPIFLLLLWLIYIFSVYAVNSMFAVL